MLSPSRILAFIFALSFCFSNCLFCQSSENSSRIFTDKSHGLHATLSAQRCYYGDPKLETLTFRLMNDSNQVLNSSTSSWKLVIDGEEVRDFGGQLWMGPKPTGGYDIVPSGKTFQFGKGLSIKEYFPKARDYKVYWKAAGFRSNEVVLKGGLTPQ